ncbi:MAG: ABC transporter ATP-binding protein [Tistlia sp.]|uniref:ABC transporter ATP-binding protein n=1 Tax=Tistlia sp. TaxID=3057121 RepID=UPI0034A31906
MSLRHFETAPGPVDSGSARAAPAGPVLTVTGLRAGYGPIQVLHGLDLEIAAGEVHAIIGGNGAGKTTLLRAISGLIQPSAGSIDFCGNELAGRSPAEIVDCGVGHAPEGHRVFRGLTVEENLRLGAFRRPGKTRASVNSALAEIFEFFPKLSERRRQLAGTLSGGEQQMCAIGRALMTAPKLLIIDELSLGLAPIIVEELLHILSKIHAAGTTLLLVEQDVSVALGFSDRATVVSSGQVALRGPARDLLADPQIITTYLGG